MKANTTLNTTTPIKALTPAELLALNKIVPDDDNPITTDDDWAGATLKMGKTVIGKTRGKQKAPTKLATTIRFDNEVIAYFKAQGKGWQTQINNVLKDYIKANPV